MAKYRLDIQDGTLRVLQELSREKHMSIEDIFLRSLGTYATLNKLVHQGDGNNRVLVTTKDGKPFHEIMIQ